jgi:peroxiredoxin
LQKGKEIVLGVVREQAPELQVSQWFNSTSQISLRSLRGRVVVLHAFQVLCPGCVAHGIPQATQIHETFSVNDLAVIGIHAVFEHHDAMQPHALAAFIHEYRLRFPIAVDARSVGNAIPRTMETYAMRGTPTLILIDRQGRIAHHLFGRITDLQLGAMIGRLISEVAADE